MRFLCPRHSLITAAALLLPFSLPAQEPAESSPSPRLTSMDVLDEEQAIVPGDRLSIRILEERREADPCTVAEDGTAQIRHLGTVKVSGMTCRKLAQFIRQKLLTLPAFTVPLSYAHSSVSAEGPTLAIAIDNIRGCDPFPLPNARNLPKLGPGSVVSIRIVEDKREALLQRVATTGKIIAPYVGLIKATGLTCGELADRIKEKLEKNFFKKATVVVSVGTVTAFEKMSVNETTCVFNERVVVFGKVKQEGKYELPSNRDLTVSGFLKLAGGHTSAKPVPFIKVIRKAPQGNKTILVNTEAVLVQKSKAHDLFLRADDVMMVE